MAITDIDNCIVLIVRNTDSDYSNFEHNPVMTDLNKIVKALRLIPDGNPEIFTRFIKLCNKLVF